MDFGELWVISSYILLVAFFLFFIIIKLMPQRKYVKIQDVDDDVKQHLMKNIGNRKITENEYKFIIFQYWKRGFFVLLLIIAVIVIACLSENVSVVQISISIIPYTLIVMGSIGLECMKFSKINDIYVINGYCMLHTSRSFGFTYYDFLNKCFVLDFVNNSPMADTKIFNRDEYVDIVVKADRDGNIRLLEVL